MLHNYAIKLSFFCYLTLIIRKILYETFSFNLNNITVKFIHCNIETVIV